MGKLFYLSVFSAFVLVLCRLQPVQATPGVRAAAAARPVAHTADMLLAGSVSVCVGGTLTLVDTVAGGHWVSTMPEIATVDSDGVMTGVAAGPDTVLYIVSGDTSVTLITVTAPPHSGTVMGTTTLCIGVLSSLTDSVAGGTWSCTNGNALISTAGILVGLSDGLDTVLYVVGNSCGADTALHFITVATPPTAGAITGDSAICTGATDSLRDSVAGGLWYSHHPAIASVDSLTGLLTAHAGGIDTVSYRTTNACATAVANFIVTVVAPPTAGLILGADTGCIGSSLAFTDASGTGIWTNHNPARGTIDSMTGLYAVLSQGMDTVYYTVTDMCGTAIAVHAVYNDSMQSSGTISGADTVCAGTTFLLTATIGGGIWNSSSATVATVDFSGDVSAWGAGTCQISYQVGSACHSASLFPLTVLGLPDAGIIDGPSGLCLPTNDTALLSDTSPGGTWSSSDPSIATIDSVGIITASSYGSVTFAYTVTNACGIAVDSFAFAVDIPVTAILGPSSICQGLTTPNIFLGAPAGGNWNSSNFLVAAVVGVGGEGLVVGTAVGTAVISYSLTNNCGTTTTTETVTVIDCDTAKAGVASTESGKIPNLELFPNPAQGGRFTLTYSATGKDEAMVAILDVAGEVVWRGTLPANKPNYFELDLPAGVYVVEVATGAGREHTKLVVGR